MLRHKNIDRVCCIVLALTLLLGGVFVGAAATGGITADNSLGYESRLFDQSRVHTIDIVMQDWDAFISTCTNEEYAACHLVIDGESYRNVAIRAKGNTSLSSVAAYGNGRYSFKVEFDHYQSGKTYHGLDKLCLNNLIQDNTYMKDYFAYTLMNRMGVASPLCSFVQINVNGESWGLYLAVEGIEEGFLQRNYGRSYGELYKPDSLSFGGGRGNGRDFSMEDAAEQFGFTFGDATEAMPDMANLPSPPDGADFSDFADSSGSSASAASPTPDATATPAPNDPADSSGASGGDAASAGTSATDGASGGMPANGDFALPDGTFPADAPTPAADASADTADRKSRRDGNAGKRTEGGGFGGFGGGFGGFGSSSDVKLQYIDDDPDSYPNIFDNAKTDVSARDKARLIASLKALGKGDASVVDQDAVLRYMAVHNFLCNDDSYTGMMVHNYYLYEKDGVLAMIPWDYNLAFGTMTGGNATSAVNTSISRLVSMGTDSDRPMAGWITADETHMAEYCAVYREFIADVFDSGWFADEIDRVTAMIAPYVESDPTAFCTYAEFRTGAETLKAFCIKRAESVTRQLDGDTAQVDASGLELSAMGSMNRGSKGDNGDQGGFQMPTLPDGMSFGGLQPDASADSQPNREGETARPADSQPDRESHGADRSQSSNAAPAPSGNGAEQPVTLTGWGWISVCAVLLLLALAFAKGFRTYR